MANSMMLVLLIVLAAFTVFIKWNLLGAWP